MGCSSYMKTIWKRGHVRTAVFCLWINLASPQLLRHLSSTSLRAPAVSRTLPDQTLELGDCRPDGFDLNTIGSFSYSHTPSEKNCVNQIPFKNNSFVTEFQERRFNLFDRPTLNPSGRMPTPTTVSKCVPEAPEEGKHVFEIAGYSKHKGMGHGASSFIRSTTFSVGGHNWSIGYYPDGYARKNTQEFYITVFLELMSVGAKVRASCDMRLIDRSTGLSLSVQKTEMRMFDRADTSRYAPNDGNIVFMNWSELETSGFIQDDRLTIECVITVMKRPRVVEIKSGPKIEVPPSDITEHLKKLLDEGERADVTFSVGGQNFAAHRVVLATRSPVFKAELYGPMREAEDQAVITIQGMQPSVFKALLHFIYTDLLPIMEGLEGNDRREMIRHLLVAADRYDMDRLKLMCQSILAEDLDAQNVAATLALADIHHSNLLKDACVEFIFSSAMEDAVATKGLKGHKKSNPFINMIRYFKKG